MLEKYLDITRKKKEFLLAVKVRKRNITINLINNSGHIIKNYSMGLLNIKGRGRKSPTTKNYFASVAGDDLASLGFTWISIILLGSVKRFKVIGSGLMDNRRLKFCQLAHRTAAAYNGCRGGGVKRKARKIKQRRFFKKRKKFNKLYF